MAIDQNETLFPLSMAVKFAPRSSRTGKYLHPSVLYRWATVGLKDSTGRRIFLETLKAGSVVTSREAIGRFIKKRSKPSDRVCEQDTTQSQAADRKRAQARVARELDSAGI